MNWIALDFSTSGATLVISQKGMPKHFRFDSLMRKSGDFFSTLNKQIQFDAKKQTLDYICVGQGPGSFTGIRLAVTIAKTMAYATGAKLIPLPTPLFIAAQIDLNPEQNIKGIIQDAKRDNVYLSYVRNSKLIKKTQLISRLHLTKELRSNAIYLGDGLKNIPEKIRLGAENSQWLDQMNLGQPTPEAVELVAIYAIEHMPHIDPLQLKPIYVYKQTCTVTPRKKSVV